MKKVLLKITLSIFLVGFMTSCGDEYFDVNTPSDTFTEDDLTMDDLLGQVLFRTVSAQYWASRSFGNYVQYFTGQGGTIIGQTSVSSVWSNTYLYSLPNLNTIISKAQASGSAHYEGVAKVLIAINMGLVADTYGNAPYSSAALGTADPQPGFDSQESIYQNIDALLNEAIGLLGGPNGSGPSPSAGADLIYAGDTAKWLRAAYTLKARYALHLSEVNGVAAANDALSALANGFTSNADDFQLVYNNRNINPWHSREVLAPNTGNVHDKVGDQLVSYMNGSSYPFTTVTIDPRLPVYADKDPTVGLPTDPYRGYDSGGGGLSSDGATANTDFADAGFYTSVGSPITVITYAEAEFIRAEAEFLSAGGTATSTGANAAAYMAYMDGIAANMNKLGVSGAAYMADGAIDVGMANLELNHIMKEKYIANFLNPETYVDMRRYDFSDDVFKDLALPIDNSDSPYPTQWLVRAVYPSLEETRNPSNVAANKEEPNVQVWWDR